MLQMRQVEQNLPVFAVLVGLALACGARTPLPEREGCLGCSGNNATGGEASEANGGSGGTSTTAACIPSWQHCPLSSDCCSGMCYNRLCIECRLVGEKCSSGWGVLLEQM